MQVHTNDPKKPAITLSVSMNIKDLMHTKKFKAAEIFSEQCSPCHVEKGRGKKGFELFAADCMMCHNAGKSALPLAEMRKKSGAEINAAIRNGIKNTAMPGWSAKKGGPLTDDEINSLIPLFEGSEK